MKATCWKYVILEKERQFIGRKSDLGSKFYLKRIYN